MYNSTVANLITRVRNETDLGSSAAGFVSDDECLGYVNSAISSLYNKFVNQYGENFIGIKSVVYNTVTNQTAYSLPYDMWKPAGVDIGVGAGTQPWINAYPYTYKERNIYNGFNSGIIYPYSCKYQFQGPNPIYPTGYINWIGPLQFAQFRISYFPTAPLLVNGTQASALIPSTSIGCGLKLYATLAGINGNSIIIVVNAPPSDSSRSSSFGSGPPSTIISVVDNTITITPCANLTNDQLALALSQNIFVTNLVHIHVIGPNDLVVASGPTNLTGGTGTTGVTTFDSLAGFEELIVIDVGIRAKDKEESDCSVLLQRKAAIENDIQKSILIKDVAESSNKITDPRRRGRFGNGWVGGF